MVSFMRRSHGRSEVVGTRNKAKELESNGIARMAKTILPYASFTILPYPIQPLPSFWKELCICLGRQFHYVSSIKLNGQVPRRSHGLWDSLTGPVSSSGCRSIHYPPSIFLEGWDGPSNLWESGFLCSELAGKSFSEVTRRNGMQERGKESKRKGRTSLRRDEEGK